MKTYKCRSLVKGIAEGYPIYTKKPINLLSLDFEGVVNDLNSDLYGKNIANRILIFSNAIGSSVGAYRLYALKMNGKAPHALVCLRKADIITVSGAAIANIPLVDSVENYEEMLKIIEMNQNLKIKVNAKEGFIELIDI